MSKRNRYANKVTLDAQPAPATAQADSLSILSAKPEIQYYIIYELTAGSAALKIYSVDERLSEAELTKMLMIYGWMEWTNFTEPDSPDCIYLGLHFFPQVNTGGDSVVHTCVLLSWPRREGGGMVGRLRRLGQAINGRYGPWRWIVGAALAAERFYHGLPGAPKNDDLTLIPAIFAALTGALAQEPGKAIGKKEAFCLAQNYLQDAPANLGDLVSRFGLDAIGTALVLLELGELLWESHNRRRLAHRCLEYVENPAAWNFLARLADGWLFLVVRDHLDVEVCGGRLRCGPSGDSLLSNWKQVIELERWHIPPQALHFLKPHRNIDGPYLNPGDLPNYDLVYGDALAEQLLTDARQNAVFVPSGAFHLPLPANTSVEAFKELYLWTDGKGLWVLPKPGGMIFYWRPEHPSMLNPLDWDEEHASALHLTLSALWRDLVVGGEQAIVHLSHERVASPAAKHRRKPSGKSNPPSTLYLPSPRKLDLGGHCTWGSPEEVEKICRRAHQVRGHVRRLLPGQKASLQAKENAERFGFLIPSGHTFVRPHAAGLKSEDEEIPETRIVALGLASLLVMGHNHMERAQ